MVSLVTLSDAEPPAVELDPVLSELVTANEAEVPLAVTVAEATVTVINSESDSEKSPPNIFYANQVQSAN